MMKQIQMALTNEMKRMSISCGARASHISLQREENCSMQFSKNIYTCLFIHSEHRAEIEIKL